MVPCAEVYHEVSRKWSKAVPEGNGPVPHQDKFGPEPTMTGLYRMVKERLDQSDGYFNKMKSHFDKKNENLNELMEITRGTRHRLAGLEQEARQSCLAIEADVASDKKTRKRTEDAAADRVMSRDSSSTQLG